MNTLPSLFVSHGAPTFALEPGLAGAQLRAVGEALPRPRAVLVVSAHWIATDARVAASVAPRTIYDFGGFDERLYRMTYPAPGHPELAQRAIEVLAAAGWRATPDDRRGLDHGAWVPLTHLYPNADVAVFQVAMPARLDGQSAFAFGAALAPLVEEGVLIVGSGSLTHNLYEVQFGQPRAQAYAAEFEAWIRAAVRSGDHDRLRHALTLAPHAQRAHPTAEHFLPLVVAAGAAKRATPVTVLEGGILHGVLSMESYVFGVALEGLASHEPAASAAVAG